MSFSTNLKKAFICLSVLFFSSFHLHAQFTYKRMLSMDDVIQLAQENSVSGMTNRNNFLASYWSYRSFKANYLPSVSVSAQLMNFNRSLVALQDYNTGEINYRSNYNLSNQVTLSIRQNIAATGGTIQLYSDMRRLDQFQPSHRQTYYVQPVTLYYLQPIWQYNSLKWDKKIEPNRYERSKRQYLESMERVTQTATSYFWNYVRARVEYDMAVDNFEKDKKLYKNAQTRFAMGTKTKDDILQLELNVLKDSISVTDQSVNLTNARNNLCSFIGYTEDADFDLQVSYVIPELQLDYDDVLDKSLNNSSFTIGQLISKLESDRSIAQAKGQRGVRASFNATFGLSNNNDLFSQAFKDVQDQEVVGVTIDIPILDWGLGKGRVKMAEAQAEATRYQLQQDRQDYERDLFTRVVQFNNQYAQCQIAKRAAQVAEESYQNAVDNFGNGAMSVTDLNALKSSRDNARLSYVNSVANYWNYYFTIRGLTLFDYATFTNISAEFDKLTK